MRLSAAGGMATTSYRFWAESARAPGQAVCPALLRRSRPVRAADIRRHLLRYGQHDGCDRIFTRWLDYQPLRPQCRVYRSTGLSWTNNLITSSGENLADPLHNDHKKPYVQDYIARFGVRKVEANALVVRPQAGRQLCLDAIQRYIPDGLLSDFEARREDAQEEARAVAERLLDQ
jgi:hypothetical protein